MVLPVSAAMRVAWSMWSALLLSIAVGLLSVLAGLTLATTQISLPAERSCSQPPRSC